MEEVERSSPGSRRRITAADVARLSGVSRATVSYVLNSVPGQTIPAQTQARVKAAAAELGYVPMAAAASLRRGHSRIVLIVTESALFGFITEPFLTAIAARLTEAGYVPVTHRYSTDGALLSLVHEIRPYGLLALTTVSSGVMTAIEESGVPRFYSSAQGDPSYPRPWEEDIGAAQAQYLVNGGAHKIIYAAPRAANPRTVIARSREIGVAAVCAAAGLAVPVHVEIDRDLGQAAETLQSAVAIDPGQAVGICAFDDEVAAVVLAAVHRLRFAIPGYVRVIGVDDAPFAPFLQPPLTTVSVDGQRTGRALAERFLNGHAADGAETVSRTVARIVERSSA